MSLAADFRETNVSTTAYLLLPKMSMPSAHGSIYNDL